MDKQIICRLRDINRAIAELERQFSQRFDLNINEAMLLCTLKEKGELSSGAVAEALGLTASNASKVIVSAEKKNLISRGLCKEDKRQMFFSLTPIGREKIDTLREEQIDLPEILKEIV
ncbi:MAG: MarR family transcriptional regulator [Bacteroidales bacterium]|nr:MarR family transcriptional regulator [Bacteroidales bacterium]